MIIFSKRPLFLTVLLFLLFLVGPPSAPAQADGFLKPANTASPRATLRTILDNIDSFMSLQLEATLSYAKSSRLYQNEAEKRLGALAEQRFVTAIQTLDLSGLPSGFRRVLSIESLVRMTDVLARIDIPALANVPDHEMMKAAGETRWRIPDTRIEIVMLSEGARAGEYLFSAQTIVSIEQIHSRTAALPVKMESVKRYLEGLSQYTSDTTLYGLFRNSAATFGVLPERWSYEIPEWLKAHILGATIWQWLSILFFEFVGVFVIWLSWHVSGRLKTPIEWRIFATSVFVVGYASIATPILEMIQISGGLLYASGAASVVLLYLSAIWSAFAGANAVSELAIKRLNFRAGGVDSQLVRLGARMIALMIATILLIEGAHELGLPAYSVLTGLGVGGLAFALAARDTLANLLGSIAIIFEKPFRSHDWIKIGDAEGTVERVGFRSTRIRTFEDSIISIPNNLVVNTMVNNLGVRKLRRQRFMVDISYDTPPGKVRAFVDRARVIVAAHPMTPVDETHIHLNEFNENGIGMLIYFHLRAPDYATELKERETILFDILELAEALEIEFASQNFAK